MRWEAGEISQARYANYLRLLRGDEDSGNESRYFCQRRWRIATKYAN